MPDQIKKKPIKFTIVLVTVVGIVLPFSISASAENARSCELDLPLATVKICAKSTLGDRTMQVFNDPINVFLEKIEAQILEYKKCIFQNNGMGNSNAEFKVHPDYYREDGLRYAFVQCNQLAATQMQKLDSAGLDIQRTYQSKLTKCSQMKDYELPMTARERFPQSVAKDKYLPSPLSFEEKVIQCKLIATLENNAEIQAKIPGYIELIKKGISNIRRDGFVSGQPSDAASGR
jgi:hypothetical protein